MVATLVNLLQRRWK